jgi:mono/diheme cytochrome c family protein
MIKNISLIGAIVAGAFLAGAAQSAFADEASIAAGEKLYKRERCETCHGGNLQGSAAFPNLLTSPKTGDKAEFSKIVLEGKGAMPAFKSNAKVAEGIDSLYDYINSKKAK